MSGHTPGPWHISSGFEIVAADNRLVATVHTNPRMDSREETANRNLITAAPEMYEALKVIHATCVERSEAGERGDWDGLALEASLAIAKAEGREP